MGLKERTLNLSIAKEITIENQALLIIAEDYITWQNAQ